VQSPSPLFCAITIHPWSSFHLENPKLYLPLPSSPGPVCVFTLVKFPEEPRDGLKGPRAFSEGEQGRLGNSWGGMASVAQEGTLVLGKELQGHRAF
jgi:hypothetical protein